MQLENLIKKAIEVNASDIHLTVGRQPTLRIDSDLKEEDLPPLTPDDTEKIAKKITTSEEWERFEKNCSADFAYSEDGINRFRVALFRQRGHIGIVMRLIPGRILTLDEVGLPEVMKNILNKNHGLILVTGPTGAGKSTTLASMINHINEHDKRHIVTIEDPIEYVHEHKQCIINQRELGADTHSFSKSLTEALRQDPDTLLVGEMRDLETIETALMATETGHLVMSTLHTFGAARTLDRIIDVFPHHQQNQIRLQLSLNLSAVISQQLIPRADKPGRLAVFEVMIMTQAIQNLIRKGETHKIPNEIKMGSKHGMISIEDKLIDLYKKKIISRDDAIFYAIDQDDILRRLASL